MNARLPPPFTEFLDSLSFDATQDGNPLVELAPATLSVTADGDQFTKPPLLLYQKAPTEVSLSGFRKKLLEFLRGAAHVATENIADAILGFSVGAAPTGNERAVFLESALTQFRTVKVSHFLVLPNKAIGAPVHFDGYHLGEINLDVLKSRCRRAESNYAELYGDQLRGRLALQSPEFEHVVFDFSKVAYSSRLLGNAFWRELLLSYFTFVSRLHFEFMWTHLDRTQVLCTPFDANFLDVQSVRNELGKFSQRVTIYLGFSRGGYVLPEGGGVVVNQPGPASESFQRFLGHRRTYHLAEVGDSELGRTLLACGGLCQQALRFLQMERPEDAALYATIALESIFSVKERTTDRVCTRTAALTHRSMKLGYADSERELRRLYTARSDFVHAGKSISASDADQLIAYARETLRSLLTLHIKAENRATGFLVKWIKNLDFIVSAFAAERPLDGSFLKENGIGE
jgi:hypothetical protein